IFPVIDIRGNVIGFSGRILSDGEPKYLNSPDTLVFSKSRNLFGLNLAKKSKSGMLILVEGNIDVVALHGAGIGCAVASLGTALTGEQARLMSRYTDRVVVCYDSDAAGIRATQRAISILEKTGLDVRVLDLPGAKDPDEYISEYGAASFLSILDRSEKHIAYRLRGIASENNLETDEGRVTYLTRAIEALADVDSAPEREVFGRTAAKNAGVSYDAVETEIKKVRAARAKKSKIQRQRNDQRLTSAVQPSDRALRYENEYSAVAEEGVLRSLVSDPETFNTVRKLGLEKEEFTSPLLGAAFEMLRLADERGERVEQATLLSSFSPPEASHLTKVFLLPANTPESERAVSDYINKIREEKLKRGEDIAAALLAVRERKIGKGTGYE
ncbi:MAG: toprim domain-containing protein, partial [Clostridiales bacterium]|nr:toprim domain-containing protein [Clostridiales bacterium]